MFTISDGSLVVGRFFGVPLKLHWSFSLIILYGLYYYLQSHSFLIIAFISFCFICVVLHEYGHALSAKYFKIKTKDIILYPIGGVARLENMPDNAKQEMIIAFAGPLVNLALSFICWLTLFILNQPFVIPHSLHLSSSNFEDLLRLALSINLLLFFFNLLPAFPMDGGRVLRAGLAMKYGRIKATKIASFVGRLFSISFIILGLYQANYLFAFLGFYIFLMAGIELKDVEHMEKLSSYKVSAFFKSQFTKLHISDKMSKPIDLFKKYGEANFLIVNSLDHVLGTLPTLFITEAIDNNAEQDLVTEWMSEVIQDIEANASLKDAYEIMNKSGAGILIVKEENNILGVIDRDTIIRVNTYL
ncbi:MAG: hypothetical protein RLZZ546_1307 [Bacteroidota bacterium]